MVTQIICEVAKLISKNLKPGYFNLEIIKPSHNYF